MITLRSVTWSKPTGDIAEAANCAVHLWHHTRKSGGAEVTVESSRGAIAFVDACRSIRILETMTKSEAERLKVERPNSYFKSYNGKRNFAPPAELSEWYRIQSVKLNDGFGDDIGVVTPWQHPGAAATAADIDLGPACRQIGAVGATPWRGHFSAEMWIGNPIAKVLRLDADSDKFTIQKVIKKLLNMNVLATVVAKDRQRHDRPFIVLADTPSDIPASVDATDANASPEVAEPPKKRARR